MTFVAWEVALAKYGLAMNLRETPRDLESDFRFKAALHREVADGKSGIKGLRKLDSLVWEYDIPTTILVWAMLSRERACSVLANG